MGNTISYTLFKYMDTVDFLSTQGKFGDLVGSRSGEEEKKSHDIYVIDSGYG